MLQALVAFFRYIGFLALTPSLGFLTWMLRRVGLSSEHHRFAEKWDLSAIANRRYSSIMR
jgi:hypothetical protein